MIVSFPTGKSTIWGIHYGSVYESMYIYNPNDIPVMFVDIDQHLSTSININIYQHEYYLNTYIYIHIT